MLRITFRTTIAKCTDKKIEVELHKIDTWTYW